MADLDRERTVAIHIDRRALPVVGCVGGDVGRGSLGQTSANERELDRVSVTFSGVADHDVVAGDVAHGLFGDADVEGVTSEAHGLVPDVDLLGRWSLGFAAAALDAERRHGHVGDLARRGLGAAVQP